MANVNQCAVGLIAVVFFTSVHDAIPKLIFESLEFHHGTVVELELRFAGESLRGFLNSDFSILQRFYDALPRGEIQNRLSRKFDPAIPSQRPQAVLDSAHQMEDSRSTAIHC